MRQILTVTLNPALDQTSTVGSLQPDKKLRCDRPVFEPGGGGINVARAIVRLGGEAAPLYFSGGHSGKRLTALLEKEGITGIPVEIAADTRENLNITDRSSGRQYRFIMPGPEITETETGDLLKALQAALKDAEYLVISGSMPAGISPGIFREFAGIAARENARMIVDTSGDALRNALQAGVYLAKPNLGELAALAGREQLMEDDAVSAAREVIREHGCHAMVVSMGGSGALLVTLETAKKIPAPVVKRLSTVGAGDSMVAGIVLALQRGMDLPEAVRFGIACGTAATMNPGTALCRKEDAEMLFSSRT